MPSSVHRTVLCAFKGTVKVYALRSGQYLEVKNYFVIEGLNVAICTRQPINHMEIFNLLKHVIYYQFNIQKL